MRCRRPNGTYYGTAGKCRQGTQDESVGEDWREINARKFPNAAENVAKLDAALEKLSEEERDMFNEEIHNNFTDLKLIKHGSSGKEYTDEERAVAMGKQAKAWLALVEMPRPTGLEDRKGNPVELPDKMTPFVTGEGTKGWIHTGIGGGRKFSPPKDKKSTVWTQNRAGGEDTERVMPHMVSFRGKRTTEGKEWPARSLPPRTDISLDRDKLITTISANQTLWKNGLNRTDKEGKLLINYYEQNPEALRRRVEDIADAYIRQGGRSGITGNPIAIPGSMPKPNEEKSTIDHFSPISGGREYTAEQLTKTLDKSSNFLLSEEGPNSLRRTTPWSEWLDKVSVSGVGGSKTKGKAKVSTGPEEVRVTPTPKATAKKAETAPKPATFTPIPSQSSRDRPVGAQKAQFFAAVSRMDKLIGDEGLSESEALKKLTPTQRKLWEQFGDG